MLTDVPYTDPALQPTTAAERGLDGINGSSWCGGQCCAVAALLTDASSTDTVLQTGRAVPGGPCTTQPSRQACSGKPKTSRQSSTWWSRCAEGGINKAFLRLQMFTLGETFWKCQKWQPLPTASTIATCRKAMAAARPDLRRWPGRSRCLSLALAWDKWRRSPSHANELHLALSSDGATALPTAALVEGFAAGLSE